ncbi:MAG: nicotinate (nicotinamide) nucleotide adenylyltransferase [bacterium]|nr:nicotinate (nicotinamide) nucleotide adenylyltransferase [bacterium]
MGKTVIFGGTFNPLHKGHIMMASLVSELDFVDQLIFMPARRPTHKNTHGELIDVVHRYNMCKIAAQGINKAVVSDFEIKSDYDNYTYYTLKHFTQRYPDKEYCLLIGADMLVSFDKWFRYKSIIQMCGLMVVKRIGVDSQDFDKMVARLRNEGAEIYLLEAAVPDISSTEIRNRVEDGAFLSSSIPPEVLDYIKNNSLYKGKY